jgi:hypothetical protein
MWRQAGWTIARAVQRYDAFVTDPQKGSLTEEGKSHGLKIRQVALADILSPSVDAKWQ